MQQQKDPRGAMQVGAKSGPADAPTILVVTDGRAGNRAQAMGLAEAMARIRPFAVRAVDAGAAPDLPAAEIVIGCGRRTAPAVRRAAAGFRIQVLDPRDDPRRYDLIIAPEHDRLAAPNAVAMLGALNRIDRSAIAAMRNRQLAALARPVVGVLVGGPNRAFAFSEKDAAALAERLASTPGSLAITASRRTPAAVVAALRSRLPGALFFDPSTDEPELNFYPALLGVAEAMIVTEDSVNMASEAATYGAPLYVAPMRRKPFSSARKFRAFHAALAARGLSRPFTGTASAFSVQPLNETARIAEIAVERWRLRTNA